MSIHQAATPQTHVNQGKLNTKAEKGKVLSLASIGFLLEDLEEDVKQYQGEVARHGKLEV